MEIHRAIQRVHRQGLRRGRIEVDVSNQHMEAVASAVLNGT